MAQVQFIWLLKFRSHVGNTVCGIRAGFIAQVARGSTRMSCESFVPSLLGEGLVSRLDCRHLRGSTGPACSKLKTSSSVVRPDSPRLVPSHIS